MEFKLNILFLLAVATLTRGQQSLSPGSSNPLGVRYSASTDVSHVSFNSPLVTYGESLSEIHLPAAPIQPANLKQLPQQQPETINKQDTTSAKTFGNQGQLQQLQVAPEQQQNYISIHQYPANPQFQNNQAAFTLTQSLPAAQPQQRFTAAIQNGQLQQLSVQPHQQQYTIAPQSQQQYSLVPATSAQQYSTQQPQQPYILPQTVPQQYETHLPQQPYSAGQQLQYPSYPASTGYFATGPYAAQYQPQQLLPRQGIQQALLPQPVAPATAQLVSRVAFNGPTAGFSYGF